MTREGVNRVAEGRRREMQLSRRRCETAQASRGLEWPKRRHRRQRRAQALHVKSSHVDTRKIICRRSARLPCWHQTIGLTIFGPQSRSEGSKEIDRSGREERHERNCETSGNYPIDGSRSGLGKNIS